MSKRVTRSKTPQPPAFVYLAKPSCYERAFEVVDSSGQVIAFHDKLVAGYRPNFPNIKYLLKPRKSQYIKDE